MTTSSWSGSEAPTLRRAIASPAALVPLMETHPDRAAEIILAGTLLNEKPRYGLGLRGGFGVVDDLRLSDPLPESGPLFAFFVHAPEVALDTLLAIVAHATDQWSKSEWAEVDDHPTDSQFEILIDDEVLSLAGNGNVLHWHRGDPRVPAALTSALMALEGHLYKALDADEDIGALLESLINSRLLAVYGVLVDVACYRPELLLGPLSQLATSPSILLVDRLYKAMHTGPFMLGVRNESTFNRLRVWHGMPHRKRTLESVVLPLVVDDGPLAGLMTRAREAWERHPDDRWRFLLAQTDPANFHAIEREDGSKVWMFELPAELQAEIDAEQTELDNHQWWASAPMQLARWIESEGEVSDDEAQTLWDDVRRRLHETSPPEELARAGVLRGADVECGAAAALLIRAPTWTTSRPEVMVFCREAVTKPFESPPPTHDFDSPIEMVNWTWDGFAALVVPRLWQADPEDDVLRQIALRLAIHPHRQTVHRFFATLEQFDELREDRYRLEVLALDWARYGAWSHERRHREQGAPYWGEGAPRVEDLPDLETPTHDRMSAFLDRSLTTELPDLRTFINETPEGLIPRRGRGVYRIAHAVEVGYLLAAWRHLLAVPSSLDANEATRRIALAQNLAEVFGSVWRADGDERDSVPTMEERALLTGLGAVTIAAPPDEARRIWEPILAAGAGAHYHVAELLNEVWAAALSADSAPNSFVPLIKEMMDFSSSHENWTGFRWSDTEMSLLCLNRFGLPRMEERHRPLLRALQPEWGDRVRALVVSGTYSARTVAAFLETPVAAEIVEQGLGWLAELERAGGRRDSDLDESVAQLLVTLAGREREIFRRLAPAGELLSALEERQIPVALQLSAQLGRSG